jgi:hypothetical protein
MHKHLPTVNLQYSNSALCVIVRGFTVSVNCKQDRQCTCNITLRHVHGTIVAVEKQ